MPASKKNLICDSNVWYAIAEGKISKSDIIPYNLIGTYMSAYELSHSPTILKKTEVWKRAVDSYFELNSRIRMETPPNYLKVSGGAAVKIEDEKETFNSLRNFRSNIDTYDAKRVSVAIYGIKDQLDSYAEDMMSGVTDAKAATPNFKRFLEFFKRPSNSIWRLTDTKMLVSQLSNDTFIAWEKHELWLYTYNQWLYELTVQPTLKMSANDWNDLMNLVYVKPGELYWTLDEKKTKEFIRKACFGHYLH